MAPDDELVSSVVFFVLAERIPESVIQPIPIALRFPDGGTDTVWFESSAQLGDVAGFGAGSPGETSLETTEGIRRFAAAATRLSRTPTLVDSADPTSLHPFAWAFTADGESFLIAGKLQGDGGGGANHMDCGAPWLIGSSVDRRALALNRECSFLDAHLDRLYATHLTPQTTTYIDDFFDPDADGKLRGFGDGSLPDRIDADGDGLSEFRDVAGTAGTGDCVAAVPPVAGRCWMPTGNDNCAPAAGGAVAGFANSTQVDREGDLVGDACDVCPDMWDPAQETCVLKRAIPAADAPRGQALAVGDRIGRLCALRGDDGADVDMDGVSDYHCDNCVPPAGMTPASRFTYANPDQLDRDHDGIGDTCDACPDTASTSADGDGDLIPNACDNCPAHANPDQANCNLDAERAAGVLPPYSGDACDSRPCADFRTINSTGWTGASTFEVVSSQFAGFGLAHTLPGGTAQTQGTLRSGFRFCACDTRRVPWRDENSLEARDDCAGSIAAGGGSCTRTFTEYGAVAPFFTQWRRPAVVWPSEILAAPAANREVILRYSPFGPSASAFLSTWNFVPDATAWGALTTVSSTQIARGVVWGHSVGYEARTVPNSVPGGPPVADPFGCPATGSCPAINRALTSHYSSAPMVRLSGLRPPDSAEPGLRGLAFFPLCMTCEAAFPSPFVGFDCGADPLCLRFGRPAIPALGDPQLRDEHGVETPIAAALSGGLDDSLVRGLERGSLDWLVAAEPDEWLPTGATRFVGIDAARGLVVHAARDIGGAFDDAISAPMEIGSATTNSRYVLSGRLHALLRVGGSNLVPMRHVWSGASASLTLSQPLGQVQAATLTWDRIPLLILVETSPDQTKERILRVNLDTGQVTVLAQFNRGSRQHDLAAVPGGRFAIAGWTASELRLVLFRLQGSAVVTEGSATRTIGMLGQLSGSRIGVSFLATDPVGGWRPEGVLLNELIHNQSGTLASVF